MKRSKWKGPFVKKKNIKNKKLLLLSRNFEITSNMVGITCNVHSGNVWWLFVMFGGCGEIAEVVTERIVLASSRLTCRVHLAIKQKCSN